MKLFRSIIIMILITILATGYVYQRIEIVKTGYSLQDKRERLSRLTDHNSKLMFQLSRLESPRNLLASLDEDSIKFADNRQSRPENFRLVHARAESYRENTYVGRFLDLFSASANAEAQTSK